jgi:hypothetical protein
VLGRPLEDAPRLGKTCASEQQLDDAHAISAPLLDLGEVIDSPILPGSMLNSSTIAARALPVPPMPRVPQPDRRRPHPRPCRELGNQTDHQVPGLKPS